MQHECKDCVVLMVPCVARGEGVNLRSVFHAHSNTLTAAHVLVWVCWGSGLCC